MKALKPFVLLLLLGGMFTVSASAQETQKESNKNAVGAVGPVKLSGLMFGDIYYVADAMNPEMKDMNGLQFRRIYFTVDYRISEKFSSRFRLEGDDRTLNLNNKFSMFIKDAWLKWNGVFSGSDLIVGISPTPAFSVSEEAWGYRFLEKTIMDYYGIVRSRDIGVDLKGKIDDAGIFRYWVKVGNDTGNSPESDKYKRYYGSIEVHPVENLLVNVYGDYAPHAQKADTVGNTTVGNSAYVLASFVSYRAGSVLTVGVEGFYRNQDNNYYSVDGGGLASQSGFGISAWAHVGLTENIRLVARYDSYDPNTASDATNDSRSLLIAAADFRVAPTVNFAPGVEVRGLEGAESSDIIPRVTFNWEF
jgi:hypothetical protein